MSNVMNCLPLTEPWKTVTLDYLVQKAILF